MAMGIAGFFIDKEGQKLGDMKMRETTLKFVIFPRPETYRGKLAILVDGGSASTTEILAQGLQDLQRARVFGTARRAPHCRPILSVYPMAMAFSTRRQATLQRREEYWKATV